MNYIKTIENYALNLEYLGMDVFEASEEIHRVFSHRTLEEIVDDLMDVRIKLKAS